ncbi:MAG: hypothetical protein R2844_16115 [Caldilineales bacterium]
MTTHPHPPALLLSSPLSADPVGADHAHAVTDALRDLDAPAEFPRLRLIPPPDLNGPHLFREQLR